MATQTYVGSLTAPAGTGSQATTGVGFTPKVVIFWSNALTTAASSTHAIKQLGFAVSSSSEISVASFDRNNVNPSQSLRRDDNAACISMFGTGGTITVQADLTSFDADGFTLNFTTTSSGVIIGFMAIGGDLTTAAIKQFQSPAGTGSQSYTGVGFKPSGMVIVGTGNTTAPPTTDSAASGMSIGFCGSALDQGCISEKAEDAVATSNCSHLSNSSNAIAMVGLTETTQYLAAVTSFDGDGFSMNWSTTAGANAYFWALCFGNIHTKVGAITQKTTTGTQAYTGVGFTPRGLLLMGAGDTTAGTATAAYTNYFGACGGTGDGCISKSGDDNLAAPYITRRRLSTSNCLNQYAINNNVLAEAAKSSFDSDGFTLNYGTADGTARISYYLAFGDRIAGVNLLLLGVSN